MKKADIRIGGVYVALRLTRTDGRKESHELPEGLSRLLKRIFNVR